MGYAKIKTKIDVQEYLEGEKVSQFRHEYLYGEVWAMAGASQNHGRIAGNLFSSLSHHLQQSPCEPFIENIKVRASEEVFYYPDVMVTCEGNFNNQYFAEEPVLIIEVLSPSTKQIDQREKLSAYQQMPSVREYVLVDQDKIAVEIHRRQPDGRWITYYFDEKNEELTFESIGLTMPFSEIYRRVNFENRTIAPDS